MRISVGQTLSEAAVFYKENFKYLMGFSFIWSVLMAVVNVSIRLELIWLFFVGVILAIIFLPKYFLAIMILINTLFDGNRVTLKEAYHQAEGKWWISASRAVVVGLIGGAPLMISMRVEIALPQIVSSLYGGIIMSLFYMLIPIIALEPLADGYLGRSTRMIKGNYLPVLILYLLTTSLWGFINSTVNQLLAGNVTALHIATTVYTLVLFFVFPFAETVIIVVYRQLAKDRSQTTIP